MYGLLLCVATANFGCWAYEIFDRRCTRWSVPISPAVVTAARFTVSVREWLPPMAVRFLPAVVQRAARFCPPDFHLGNQKSMSIAHSKTGVIAGRSFVSPCSLFLWGSGSYAKLSVVSSPFAPWLHNSPSKYTKYPFGSVICPEPKFQVDISPIFRCEPPRVSF